MPDARLHTNTVIGVFAKEGEPHSDGIRMPITDLDKPPQCVSLEILLRLLVGKIATRDCPPFDNTK